MDDKVEDLLRRRTEIVAGGGEAKLVYPGDTTIFTDHISDGSNHDSSPPESDC